MKMGRHLFSIFLLGYCAAQYVNAETVKKCTITGCEGEDCTTLCINGDCSSEGLCECLPCWSGSKCDKYKNNFYPKFTEQEYVTVVSPSFERDTSILEISALDEDFEITCEDTNPCPCGTISYSIESGNYENVFNINKKTGQIYSTGNVPLEAGESFDLLVAAQNHPVPEDPESQLPSITYTSVTINVEGKFDPKISSNNIPAYEDSQWAETYDYDKPHSRHKRAVYPDTVDEMTFYLLKDGDYENITTMYVGSRIHFKLMIHFPALETVDILVELFTPDNETTIMVVCKPEITHVGNNFPDFDKTTVKPVLEGKTPDTPNYDRAILNLGNITNDGAISNDELAGMIWIEWDVVMIKNNETVNGSVYWASAGAEYNNSDEVWVGQASFETITEELVPTEAPSFNLTGPESVEIGSSAVFRVDMYLPYDSIYLVFDAFAPINNSDTFSVCSIVLADTASNYECLEKERFKHTEYKAASGRGNDRARLVIGEVTNKRSREANNPTEENRISIEFVVYLYDDTAFIGQEYWLGAAIELGDSQIWAGQIKVDAVARATANMTETPSFSLTTISGTNVSIGQSVKYELEMKVPENTDTEYELEVLMPYNDSAARFKVCLVNITYQGINVPCVGDAEPVYSSRDNSTIMDRAVFKIGRIRNFGHRDEVHDPDANKIKFDIIAQVLNHSLNLEGEKVWITAGMMFGSERLWVGQNAVYLEETIPESENDTSPTFDLEYAFGDDYVPINSYTDVRYTITTKPGGVYFPMDVELIMPFENDTAVYTVCRAQVLHAGKNMPCFNATAVNESISYTSKDTTEVNSTRYDKAILNLGYVCNVATEAAADVLDDQIIINVVMKVEEHPSQDDNNTKNWVSAGVMFHPTKMWVGQIALFAANNTNLPYYGELPYVTFMRRNNDTSTDLMQGDVAVYEIIIKLPPQSVADWTVTIDVTGQDLHVCALYIKKVGYGIPCLDKTKVEPTRTKRVGTNYDEKLVINLEKLTNVAEQPLVQNDIFDNGTIVLEFAVQSDLLAAVASTQTIRVELDHGDLGPEVTENIALNIVAFTAPNETTNATMPEFVFSLVEMHENVTASYEVGKGQPIRFTMDITPPEYSSNKLIVKFLTPVNETGVMEICNVNIIKVGRNIPCLKKEEIDGTITPRLNSEYDDIGGVELGMVCQVPIDEEDPEANKITIEAIARVTKINTKVDGDKVWFSSTVRINDDQIYVVQQALIIKDGMQYNQTEHDTSLINVEFNMTDSVLYVNPGEIFTMEVDITMPPNATINSMVDVDLPANGSAVVTLNSVKIISAGANLACLGSREEDYELISNSTYGTTQMNKGYLDLGMVTNTGHTYRHNVREEGDDSFRVQAEMRFADAEIAVHDSEHWVSFGFKGGDVLIIADKKIKTNRTDLEQPDLILDASINSSDIFTQSECVYIDALLAHTNLSTAEGYNVSASFYIPNYMQYNIVNSSNYTNEPVISNVTSPRGVVFTFDVLYFTDVFAWTFSVCVIPVPGSHTQQPATTPYEAGCNIIYRDNHANESGTYFVSRLTSLSYQVLPPGTLGGDCVPASLNIADQGSVLDCQITGSESPYSANPPYKGRDGGDGWIAATRRGNFTRYLQVNFGNITKITQVNIQNPSTMTNRDGATVFTMMHSDDDINWEEGETVTINNLGGASQSYSAPLASPMESRYVRLVFDEDTSGNSDGTLAVTVGFDGCGVTGDVPFEDVCNMHRRTWNDPNANVTQEFMTRSFLSTGSEVYFCDANPYKDHKLECFTSGDGLSWEAVDSTIINILGVLNGEVYGIAWDKRAFMHTNDGGQTWMAISYTQFAKAEADAGFIAAQEVKWVREFGDTPLAVGRASPHTTLTQNNYGAYYEGIYSFGGGFRVADWTQCCQ